MHALSILRHRLERGTYERGSILHTSYLGPDTKTLSTFGGEGNGLKSEDSSIDGASSSTPITFYIATGALSLALFSVIVFLAMASKLRRTRKAVAARVSAENGNTQSAGTMLESLAQVSPYES